MRGTDAEECLARLRLARKALGLARLRHWTQRGLATGAVLAALVLGVAHIRTFGLVLPLSIAALFLGFMGGITIGLWHWPDSAEAARIVDHHFALDDRITTALQFRFSSAPLAQLQRADLAQRLRRLTLNQSQRSQVVRKEGIMMIGSLLGFVILLFVGGVPRSAVSASVVGPDQARIREAAKVSMPIIMRALQPDPLASRHSDPALSQLDFQLALLRHQLLHAQTRSSALRSISLTQLRLRQLVVTLHAVDARTVHQLNLTLGQYGAPGGGNPNSDPSLTARSLKQLANTLAMLSAAQRYNLARALAGSANTINEPHLRAYLHQAASSLAYNDPPRASRALQKAASFLASTQNAPSDARNLKAANQQLEQLKNSLYPASRHASQRNGTSGGRNKQGSGNTSASRSGRGRSRSSQNAQSSARTAGASASTLTRRNTGPGREVSGPNSEAGANGRVSGITYRKSGEGGIFYDVSTPGKGSRANRRGATVYVPGVQGRGPHAVQLSSNAAPQTGKLVPYRQVIVRYTRSAHAALDRATLPPSLESYVRQYFDQLAR